MAGLEFAEWFKRGRAHQVEGRPVEAQACYVRAIRLAPAAADVRFRLGEVLWQLGRLPDAVAAWEDAARLAPRHPASMLALAEAHLGLGDLAAAHEAGQRAFELAPAEPRAVGIAALTTAMRAREAGDDAAATRGGDATRRSAGAIALAAHDSGVRRHAGPRPRPRRRRVARE